MQQLFSGVTELLLRSTDENCTVGQGLACHFNTALCTLHGFNVVCAAGLVPRSCEIVLGQGGWECSADWEGESLFKLSQFSCQLESGTALALFQSKCHWAE